MSLWEELFGGGAENFRMVSGQRGVTKNETQLGTAPAAMAVSPVPQFRRSVQGTPSDVAKVSVSELAKPAGYRPVVTLSSGFPPAPEPTVRDLTQNGTVTFVGDGSAVQQRVVEAEKAGNIAPVTPGTRAFTNVDSYRKAWGATKEVKPGIFTTP